MENQTQASSEQPIASEPEVSQPAPALAAVQSYPGMPQPPAGLTERLQNQRPPRGKMPLVIAIIAVLILVLGGVGGYWYYAQGQALLMTRQMSWPWGNSQKNFKVAIDYSGHYAAQSQAPSATSSAALWGNPISLIGQNADFNYKITGTINNYDQQSEGNLNLEIKSPIFNLTGVVDYLFPGQDWYFRVSQLDEATKTEMSKVGFEPAKVLNHWLAIAHANVDADTAGQEMANIQKFNQKTLDFINGLKRSNLLVVTDTHQIKTMAAEQIKKVNYRLKAGKGKDFYDLVSQSYATLSGGQSFPVPKDDPEALANFEKILEQLEINLWLGTSDKVIYGLELVSNNFQFLSVDNQIMGDFSLTMMIEPVAAKQITAPTDATTLEQLMASVIGPGDTISTSTVSLDLDSDGLIGREEDYYGSDPLKEDTDGDGYFDGEEVQNGFNPAGAGKLTIPLYAEYLKTQFQTTCLSVGGKWMSPVEDMVFCNCPNGTNVDLAAWQALNENLGDVLCQSNLGPLLNDAKINPNAVCVQGGGQWMAVAPKSVEQCRLYGDWDSCEKDAGCDWDSFGEPQICISARSYCQCQGSLKIFEDSIGLGFRCQ